MAEKQKPSAVFLTVPHAECTFSGTQSDDGNTDSHWCDLSAKSAAVAIANALTKRELVVVSFVSDTHRRICDLNRTRCRDQGFRPQLTEATRRRRPLVLLDVHSFPRDHNSELDFYILVDYLPNFHDESVVASRLARSLVTFLKSHTNMRVEVLSGVNNDIVDTSMTAGIPALLLEFSEALGDKETGTIADAVADWMVVHMKKL